jgi:hypothetical protein
MAVCFSFTVMAFIYGILFVDQPMEQAPTDAQLIDLLSTLLVFLTGTLSGLVASNGLKSKTPARAGVLVWNMCNRVYSGFANSGVISLHGCVSNGTSDRYITS